MINATLQTTASAYCLHGHECLTLNTDNQRLSEESCAEIKIKKERIYH